MEKILFECASFITCTKKRSESESYSAAIILFTKVIFLTQSGLAHSYLLHMQRIRIHTGHYSDKDCWYLETVD